MAEQDPRARHLPIGPPRPVVTHAHRDTRRDVVLFAAFTMLGLLLYGLSVWHPGRIVFDEAHYVKAARNFAAGQWFNPSHGDLKLPHNFEHPPVGKYLIMAGMGLFGDNPFGWRAASALVGALGLGGMYLLGRRLFDRPRAGVLAASLLAAEPIYYTHANLAMLEVFPASFTVLAMAMVLGGDRERRLSGLVFGLAVASKYPSLFLMPLFLLVHWLRAPVERPGLRLAYAAGLAVAVPIAVWLATYVPFVWIWVKAGGVGLAAERFVLFQVAAFAWDFGGSATHNYSSPMWSWVPMVRPVWYYVARPESGWVGNIYSVGNPATWWPATAVAVVALVGVPWRHLRGHGRGLTGPVFWEWASRLRVDWSPAHRRLVAGLMFASALVPYAAVQRITFHYYMVGVVPFLLLALAGAWDRGWSGGGRRRMAVWVNMVLAGVVLVALAPLAEGFPVPRWWTDAVFSAVPWMRR